MLRADVAIKADVAIEEDDRHATLCQPRHPIRWTVEWSRQQSTDAMLLEQVNIAILASGHLIAAREQNGVSVSFRCLLACMGKFGKKWVCYVQHDHAQSGASAKAKLPSKIVAYETELVHRPLNPCLRGG
jgi:hypothetical protein